MNTPDARRASEEAKEVAQIATQLVIDSDDMYEIAAGQLIAIKQAKKKVDEKRKEMTVPLDESKKAIMDFFRPVTDKLDASETDLKRKMLAYTTEIARRQKEQREAEEARRRAEQEEAQRQAQQLVDEACDNPELIAQAVAITAEAELIAALPVVSTIPTPKAAGITPRDNWKAEVTSFDELFMAAAQNPALRKFFQINMPAINSEARELREGANIPGVRVFNDKIIAARTK